jgi:hypothetical protein
MAYTQNDINNIVDSIVNQYGGKSISYFGSYPNECSVPAAYYVDRLRGSSPIPGMANNRADGWGTNFPDGLRPHFTHESFQAGKSYPKGTILMWNSPHIAIVLRSDGGNTVEVFEQNADPDGSVCGIKNRVINAPYHTCTYALIPITVEPAPSPPPIPYTVELISQKQVMINKDVSEWNLSYDNLTAIGNNPLDWMRQGMIVTVVAILHHNIGYNYYLPDATIARGYNVVDCDDYTPPPPQPIVIPAPTPSPPSGALIVPTPDAKYYIIKTILGFLAYSKAAAHEDASTTVAPGSYFIYKQTGGMINITKKQGIAGYWINPADNVIEITPPDDVPPLPIPNGTGWKASYSSFSDDRTPIKFVLLEDYIITDIGSQRPNIPAKKGTEINIYGSFVKDDIMYFRPKLQADTLFQYYYGVPAIDPKTGLEIMRPYDEVYDPTPSSGDHITTKHITLIDRLVIIEETISRWWHSLKNSFK